MKLDEEQEYVPLYKVEDGTCNKSYGMNVATFAGIDGKIINRANVIASSIRERKEGQYLNLLTHILNCPNNDASDIKKSWDTLHLTLN